ncbi:glutamyl aminopeptidase-like [Frankliniella occidentalis]|uniref:Aminopeptidase n=1 Tax=Frankliniella occidentalis TaxID=133901 RepID=A0A9C6XWA8_FRAOC|nr:glutamyl aminopeptidase-like [Frankliniella occidentalis]
MACPSRWCWCTCWCTLVLAVLSARSAPAALATPERLVGPPRPHDLLRPRPALGQAGDASYRLPGDAHPLHYDIHIGSNLDKLFFLGTVDITLQVDKLIEKGKPLTLHADSSIDIDPSNKCTLDGNEVDHELSKDGKDFIRFTAKTDLMAGTVHVLHCEYRGKIFEDDKGFYRSQYDGKGVKINIGVTQFEMTFARRALPCFDEPGYRATFALAITHHVEESAVSNTQPAVIVSVNATHAKTTFEATPAMAVYTLAWLVSRMPSVASADGDFPFATYAQPKYIDDTSLSQSVGPQVLAGMADYTGIEYALDKMDQAALPDFNFGAMENWGLVTYRQGLLLAGADSRSTTNLSVTTTIAHELAHQWFGNLVTPSWWGHVWLSEAFAELFCYLMTDKINPEWKVLDKMPLMEMHDAFVEDSLISSAPMTNENIYTPDEILDNFGSITYAKGSSVLRMLRDTMDSVSADSFRKGLQSYLNAKKQSGVVEPDDLWQGLESVGVTLPGGLSVTDLGKKWTEQAGYPVITVTRTGDTASVAQVRFLSEEPANPPTPVTWPVPLTWKAPGTTVVSRSFLTEESGSISGIPKDAAWVLFNVDQLGYYRVNYDNDGWKALTDTLVSDVGSLTVPERAMLVDDALTLARAGKLSYETALSLQGYLVAERQYAPWAAFASSVEYLALHCRAAGGEIASLFDRWVAGLTERAYHDLDFSSSDKDTFEDKLTRSVVVQVAFEANLFLAVTDASLAFLNSRMEPDTARLALCKGLTDSHTDEVYKDLLKKLKLSTDEMKRRDYTYALGCAPENEEVQLKTE